MGSGGWWSSHPKDFWNWSHGLFTNRASFSSVAQESLGWQGWTPSPGCRSRVSWVPLAQPRPPEPRLGNALLLASAGSYSEMLEEAKMLWLPTLLKLWKTRLAFAVRRGSGEGEAHPTIRSPPMAPFLWGQGGSSRGAHSFSLAYPILILEFCLP